MRGTPYRRQTFEPERHDWQTHHQEQRRWLWLRRKHRGRQAPHRKHRRRTFVSLLLAALVAVLLFTQGNGVLGARSADLLRTILGPRGTAQIEAWYLNAQDTGRRIQYHFFGTPTHAPWRTRATAAPSQAARQQRVESMPLVSITPTIQPALAGEGVWNVDGMPVSAVSRVPLAAKTFLRPDPARPYAVVTLPQFDLRFDRLHMVAGTAQPGGPRHMYGSGVIPTANQQGNTLLAAFNGGFKYADGQYGMMVHGTTYVPPQQGAATIAVTREGQVLLGAWGKDPLLSAGNSDLVAWRQNAALLIDAGKINPLTGDGAAWGGTILNSTYTWRSGIGITRSGTLLYAAGNSLSAATLARALQAAGAVTAMQTDINPYWVRAFLYHRAANGSLQATKLHPGMQGTGSEYLRGTQRDFFYVTRATRVPPCRRTPPALSATPAAGCGG